MNNRRSRRATAATRRTYLTLTAEEWLAGTVSLALDVGLNTTVPERYHVPASLTAAGLVSGLAVRAGVGLEEQGLRPADAAKGALYGLAAAVPIAAALATGARVRRLRSYYRAGHVVETSPRATAYEILVRVPFGTALPEEVIFRGALLSLLSLHHRPLVSGVLSSLLFGVWHVIPTLSRLRADPMVRAEPPVHKAVWLAGSIGVTSAAGLLLVWLRNASGSIVAPWFAHTAANATGLASSRWIIRPERSTGV